MGSVWADSAHIPHFPTLEGDTKTDVLIIGGGMAGVLCAHFLARHGVEYLLVEGDTVGGGVTSNTTAKITSQHGLIYDALLKKAGAEKARLYWEANQLAIEQFAQLCADIPCGFERKNAFVYSLTDQATIEREVSALDVLRCPAAFVQSTALPFDIAGAVRFDNQAQFHPLQFIAGLSKGLNIREHTFVHEIGKTYVLTNHGRITAERIIVATHFPILNKHGAYFMKMYQHRSYAIALQSAPNLNGMYLEEKMDGLSFRNHENLLIIGGGDHKTGATGGNWAVLRALAEQTYPNATEAYAWATQDCMTLDAVPYIGPYAKFCENLYVATGFNKWGMTSSMVAAMLLCDMVRGKQSAFTSVFSPQRSMLKPQLVLNGLNSMLHLLSLREKTCPHMGCALKWNRTEQSWDCPCHGSRFDAQGRLLDNPATGGLRK